jgi:hypothetical protein
MTSCWDRLKDLSYPFFFIHFPIRGQYPDPRQLKDTSLGIVIAKFSMYVAESFLLETCLISFA